MFLVDRIKQLRLKCRILSKPQTSSLQSSTNRDLNDDINNKVADLIEYHDQIENILRIANKKYSKAIIKELRYATRYQNALKELDHLRQENMILEKYIFEVKSHSEMIENIKQENDCLHLIYKKNISTIFRLKKEMLNTSELLYNKPPLFIDLDDDLLGFDTVTVSKSETKIDPQNETYQSLYYKIQKDSADIQHAFNSLFSVMNQTNLSLETIIKYLNLVSSQTMHSVKVVKKQFLRILQNDHDAINKLTKTRYFLEQQKINCACRLNILETDIKSLGNRVEIKYNTPYHTHDKYSNRYLNKLSIKQLLRIWSKVIKITEWPYNLKEIDS